MRKSCSPLFIQVGFLFTVLFLLRSTSTVGAQFLSEPPAGPSEPDPTDVASSARWLVAKNTWGVLSTNSIDLGGAPYGNVVSFSDGEPGHGFGVPYFYLANLEPEGGPASINGTMAAFTVSEDPLGTCKTDTQDPKCKKATLTGKLKWISIEDPEVKFAEVALFTKHPEMQGFPRSQNFQIHKLVLEKIFLVNEFGKTKHLTPEEYLKGPPINLMTFLLMT